MTDIIFKHKFISILVILVVIVGAWYMLSGSPAPTPDLVSTTPSSGPDQDLVNTLLTLRTVTLSGTIFTEPAFESLKDNSTQIISEPVGRPDPFAPLSSSVLQNATTTSNPRLFAPKQQ